MEVGSGRGSLRIIIRNGNGKMELGTGSWIFKWELEVCSGVGNFFLTQQYRLFSNYSAFLQIGMC
jgi:hypothetical protein